MRGARPLAAIERHLEEQHVAADGATVLLACSGGPDSVALAGLLARISPQHRWRTVLAHVNHHVRASSWQDECIVLAASARLGLDVRVAALEPRGQRSEASLRARRYDALTAIAGAEGATVVVTAHTAEDQTESVLLALFRGTGLRGLSGIQPRRRLAPGIELVRPLLQVARRELHAELASSVLPYVRDPTNDDQAYRRNAVRAALRGLREQFPRLDDAVARCAAIVAGELDDAPRSAARRRLRAVLEEEAGLTDVPFERIEAALRAGRGRIFVKHGVEIVKGEQAASPRVVRRKS
ncbi:MAG: tRNA lysidine(34) synthetase TilS [Vulcanimicrobiaceae bacterium]